LLNESAAKGGQIAVDKTGRVERTGGMMTTGLISASQKRLPFVLDDFLTDPVSWGTVYDVLKERGETMKVTISGEGKERSLHFQVPDMQLEFSAKTGGLLKAQFLAQDEADGPFYVYKECIALSARELGGFPFPSQFSVSFFRNKKLFSKRTATLIPEKSSINGDYSSLLVQPVFPIGCRVKDEIKNEEYLVSQLEKFRDSVPGFVDMLNKAISEANERGPK
jgi:hypothetical protein